MTTLKAQLEASGLHVSVTLRETGQQLVLNFKKGERRKKVHVVLGDRSLEGEIELLDLSDVDARLPNLALSLTVPAKVGRASVVATREMLPVEVTKPAIAPKVNIPVETAVSATVPLTVDKTDIAKQKVEVKKK